MEQIKQEKTNEEVVKEYFADPYVKQRHIDAANQLYLIFKNQWFTIRKVIENTLMKNDKEVAQLLMGLRMFNLCDAQDRGIGHKRKTHFKITLSQEDRLKVLESQKNKLLKQIELIDVDIEKVKEEGDLLNK